MQTLADEFAAMKFDVRAFLRELALSQAYQRSSVPPAGVEAEPERFLVALLKPLTPEQLAWGMMQATGLTDAERLALGDKATEAALRAKLVGNEGPFVAAFRAGPAGGAEVRGDAGTGPVPAQRGAHPRLAGPAGGQPHRPAR